MKKKLFILLCIASTIGCILSLYAGITCTGSGFLDISNLVQFLCFLFSFLFGLSAAASLYFTTKM